MDSEDKKPEPSDAEREMRAMRKVVNAVERELPNLSTDSRAWLRARLSSMLVPTDTAS